MIVPTLSMADKEFEAYLKKLGGNIKRIRESKNISQVDLANACEFEKSNMRRIEAGNTNVTAKTLYKIAKALEVTIAELVNV